MRRVAPSAGFTIIEMLIVMALLGIVSSLAVIGIRSARIRTAETAAVSALQAINQAQFVFSQTCGHHTYAPTLVSLGTPPPGSDSAFLSPDLTMSDPLTKSGYLFTLAGTTDPDSQIACNGVAPLTSYQLTAEPLNPGYSGIQFFGTNSDRVIYGDITTYTGNMPEAGAPGHGAEVH